MIKCFVIDDEAHAIEVLARYIQRTPGLELIGSYEDPLVALHLITEGTLQPDLTFVDINMPDLTGLDLAALIHGQTAIAFTTAYPDYALNAFEANALDYLLKPITYERFLQAVQKVRSRRNVLPSPSWQGADGDYFFVKGEAKGKLFRVRLKEIVFIESLQNYIKIYTHNGSFITYLTLQEIGESLPTTIFSRVHKSYIVNTTKVQAIEGNQIHLDGGLSITLGASYRELFLEKINIKLIRSKRRP